MLLRRRRLWVVATVLCIATAFALWTLPTWTPLPPSQIPSDSRAQAFEARPWKQSSDYVKRSSLHFNKQINLHGQTSRHPWISDRVVKLHDAPGGWPRPWTALTFSGNMRSMAYPAVLSSLRSNLLNALGGTVLVFLNVRLTDQARSGIDCINSEDDLFGALQFLLEQEPERFVVWRASEVIPPNSAPLCPDGSFSANNQSYSQTMSLVDSFSLVRDYEARLAVRYAIAFRYAIALELGQ